MRTENKKARQIHDIEYQLADIIFDMWLKSKNRKILRKNIKYDKIQVNPEKP